MRLAKELFTYRTTPQNTTGISQAELLVGRKLISRLDLVRPSIAETVDRKQEKQKQQHDRTARERKVEVGDLVYIRNYNQGSRWLQGKICEPDRRSNVSCLFKMMGDSTSCPYSILTKSITVLRVWHMTWKRWKTTNSCYIQLVSKLLVLNQSVIITGSSEFVSSVSVT